MTVAIVLRVALVLAAACARQAPTPASPPAPLDLPPPTGPAAAMPRAHDPRSGITFVLVPAGEFECGGADRDELPRHRVRLSRPYWLAATEVTVAQWRHFVATGQADAAGLAAVPDGDERLPMPTSHVDALAFCRHHGYRLPTEAEWEHACRAGQDGVSDVIDLDAIAAEAWFHRNSDHGPHPVATRRANAFGLHDLLGNVWEWCADRYAPTYGDDRQRTDPTGPTTGAVYVLRGGSWFSLPPALPWTRGLEQPEHRCRFIGFRPACDADRLPASR
jgi:formylglycine-generating enzyme required for sulfatase activity